MLQMVYLWFVLVLLAVRQPDSRSGDTGSNPVEDANWLGPSWANCLRTHLVKRSDCRSDEGSSILLEGAVILIARVRFRSRVITIIWV